VFDSTAIHRSQGEASTIPPGQLTQMRYSYSMDFNGFQWISMVSNGCLGNEPASINTPDADPSGDI